jgi:hypothetical protein
MTSILFCILAALQGDPPGPQDQARRQAAELRRECAEALKEVDGVGAVGLGGTGEDYRLLIAVRDPETLRAVRELVGGDSYGGLKIIWSVAEAPRPGPPPGLTPSPPPVPEPLREKPLSIEPFADRNNIWQASVTDCDIIREHLKLKKITHPSGNGMSWVPCQIVQRTSIGPDGGHSFTYTRHRPDCPVRMGRVGEPSWSDNYMAWVFRTGMTSPSPTNFTIPGNSWDFEHLSSNDMASRMPQVREGATNVPVWPYGPYAYGPYSRPYPYSYYSYYSYYWYPRYHWRWWPCRPYYRWHWRYR